ncbi:ferritin-like domain-containing protein [Streptomyces sp. NPDC001903]|uniref:ferritin-like domain-containing protein n=1 Tax=Streptomyces sp. NPDC001903 TaxID=3364622 RepID=UPI0036CB52C6
MNPPMAGESGCQLMKRLAKELKASIAKTQEHASEVANRITELEAQANPDQSQISALKQTLEVLRKKIEEERASLSELEDVISENC